ncbi:hypothetical protein ACOMHN_008200 [Nucella lapillus]
MAKLVQAMREENIPFTFLVGDLPTYKTIVQIKAENPELFEDITPIVGAFHQQMSYIHAIYKRFNGSGMSDTLVTAGVIVDGSVDQALRGKHYRCGVRCIMLWREALIHQRLKDILEHEELSEAVKEKLDIVRDALTETQEAIHEAHGDLEEDDNIKDMIKSVYEKPGTDMGDFWISFMEMTDPLAQNLDACHARNGPEVKAAVQKTVMETAMTNPEARELLERVGESLDLENSVKADMKSFVLSSIYGESADATCRQARASKWHKMKRKSTFRLPPDDDSLNLHVERTNYITYCQLHYNLFGHSWELVDGKCRPVRYTQPPLPQQLTLRDYSDESGSDDERSEPGDSTDTEDV